jgi:thioesterase domain-containing protein/aryl carrier-like protein
VDAAAIGGKTHVAPGDAIEQQLADIWSQLLRVSNPGIHDDFFESGGNSLTMIQLAHKINTAFEKELQLLEIMKHPTIAELKTLLTQETTAVQSILTLKEGALSDTAFIIPGALGSTEGYLNLAENLPVEGAVYGLQMKGVNGEALPNTTIAAIAAYNLDLIRQTGVTGNISLVGHSYAGIVLYEMLKQATDIDINKVIMLDCFINPLSTLPEIDKLATYFRSLIKFSQPDLSDDETEELITHMKSLSTEQRMPFIYDTVSMLPASKVAQMWAVFNAAVSAVYTPDEKLDYAVQFIQADNSALSGEDWGTNGAAFGWDQFFSELRVINTDANHFTVVNTPYCNEWITKINIDQTLPII